MDWIRKYLDFSDSILINKGYSDDQKYLLTTKNHKKYLLRITKSSDPNIHTIRKKQFELIKQLGRYSSKVPRAYHFGTSDDSGSCFMILEYFEGEDGETSLPSFSEADQYKIGYTAGEELQKLHSLPAPAEIPPWHHVMQKKYDWYCSEFYKNPRRYDGIDLDIVESFVRENMHIMENTNQTFQHDDYHPANLIIQNRRLNGIIDFNRCDWGDPIHDFDKVALFTRNINIPFARGEIDGYNDGSVHPGFWKRYALYSAMTIIPNLVWSAKYAFRTHSPDEIQKSVIRNRIIYQDHDGFSSMIPEWYKE